MKTGTLLSMMLAMSCGGQHATAPKPQAPLPATASDSPDATPNPKLPPEADAVATPVTSPYAMELSVGSNELIVPKSNPRRYRSWRERGRIKVGKSHLSIAEISTDETYLIAHSQSEGTIRIYERATKKMLGNYQVDGFASGTFLRGTVTYWPGNVANGAAFLVGNTKGLALYSMVDGTRIKQFDDGEVWSMRWTDDGRHLVCTLSDTSNQTSVLSFFERNGETLRKVGQMPMPERVDEVALSRDKTLMAFVNYPSDTVELLDLRTGESRWKVPAPKYAGSVDISPDATHVVVAGAKVVLIDVANPKRQAMFSQLGNNADAVRFSPSGDALAVSAYDGHLRILSAELTTTPLRLLKDLRHNGKANVYAVRFLADGSGLISSSGDRTIRYWGK